MKEAEIRNKLSESLKILRAGPFFPKNDQKPGEFPSDFPTEGLTTSECLDQLRLQLKYLLFDLEATKRENRYLRQMLATRRGQGLDDPPDDQDPPS